ncbi:MAG: starch-binding protein, partial [Muribaculaceae bacterium]|nr:starch-binding protein [Muribaculaceae bacterium]
QIVGATESSKYNVKYNVETNQVLVTLVEGGSQGGGDEDPGTEEPIPGETWTVSYTNPLNWATPYAYSFVKGEEGKEALGTWPGTAMTKAGDVWTISGKGEASHIIFNDGKKDNAAQTDDLVFENSKTYSDGLKDSGSQGGGDEDPGTDPKPEGPDYSKYYVNIIGEYDWNFPGQQPGEDNIATLTEVPVGTDGFQVKIWDGENDLFFTAQNLSVTPGQWTQMYQGEGNINQIVGATESSKYNVKYNVETNQVLVTLVEGGSQGGGDEDPGTDPKPELHIYLLGSDVDGEDAWKNPVEMTYENDVYTWSGSRLGSGFKFNNGDWNSGYNIGAPADATQLTPGVTFSLINDGDSKNITLASETYIENPVITLDLVNLKLTVNGKTVNMAAPDYIYLLGGDDWENGIVLYPANGNTYVGEGELNPKDGVTEIKLKDSNGTWHGAAAEESQVNVTPNKEITLNMVEGDAPNWTLVNWSGELSAKVDWDAKTLTLECGYSRLNGLNVNLEGDEVIYTINGIRVDRNHMGKGLYIINGKKVLVK